MNLLALSRSLSRKPSRPKLSFINPTANLKNRAIRISPQSRTHFYLSADRFPTYPQRIDSEKTHNSTRDVDQRRQSNSRRVSFVA